MTEKSDLKKAEYVSCEDRVKLYGKGVSHTTGGKLFCSICNITIDDTQKGTIDRHVHSNVHAKKRKSQEDVEI